MKKYKVTMLVTYEDEKHLPDNDQNAKTHLQVLLEGAATHQAQHASTWAGMKSLVVEDGPTVAAALDRHLRHIKLIREAIATLEVEEIK